MCAWIVGDGFDYYNSVADLARSVWDSYSAGAWSLITGTNTRFNYGQGIQGGAGGSVTKNFGSNESTVYVALAYYRAGALSGTTAECYVYLQDGATKQCTIVFESSGNIVLKSGSESGTVLATYTAAYAQDVWSHFQIRVVISNTAGSMTVRKNGSPSDTYASATTLNTRGGTTNNYCNTAVFVGWANSVARFDDLLIYSSSGGAPNTWVGDTRAIALMPAGDTATKTFGANPGTTATFGGAGIAGGAPNIPANTLNFSGPYTPTRGGTLTKITIGNNGAVTGHVKMAIYLNDGVGGIPGTRIAVSDEMTNPPSSASYDITFTGGPNLSPLRSYYFAYLTDTAGNWQPYGGAGAAGTARYYATVTYASGFPATAPALTVPGGNQHQGVATQSGNCVNVSELIANSDTDYVLSTTVGQEDLYAISAIPVVPYAIYGVVSKAYMKKSDAGTRQGMLRTRSGATDANGVDTAVSQTYTYLSRVDTVDPATGTTWTVAGVNAFLIGQKCTL